ncbi:MAG: chemotaxis protein CheW [Rhodoferax sp.]|nr:chemotaxis protein CheW [Rhodoferax sp.]
MANREALRELQTRLASRLQAARTEEVSASWLAATVGERHCLFPLSQSGEIFPLTHIQAVPYAQSWFRGVTNLRGSLCGVVDLASFMGDASHLDGVDLSQADVSVVTFNAALEINCALLVSGLAGLRKNDAFVTVNAAPKGSPVFFGNQFIDRNGVSWQEINLQILSQSTEFLSVSA